MRSRRLKTAGQPFKQDGEFLWLISLSDLMILLFVFFVVLFSFSFQKLEPKDLVRIKDALAGEVKSPPLEEAQKALAKWIMEKGLVDSIEIEQKHDALVLQIKERVLFDMGHSELRPGSTEIVSLLGEALRKVPPTYRLGIEGHTDDTPMRTVDGKDNWALSLDRALSVFRALAFDADQAKRAVVMGYGEMKPLHPNRDETGRPIPENQQRNRRVTIRIF